MQFFMRFMISSWKKFHGNFKLWNSHEIGWRLRLMYAFPGPIDIVIEWYRSPKLQQSSSFGLWSSRSCTFAPHPISILDDVKLMCTYSICILTCFWEILLDLRQNLCISCTRTYITKPIFYGVNAEMRALWHVWCTITLNLSDDFFFNFDLRYLTYIMHITHSHYNWCNLFLLVLTFSQENEVIFSWWTYRLAW